MTFRRTTDDVEAKEFAQAFGLVESMEKERQQGQILFPDKGQIVVRKIAGINDGKTMLGLVLLFGGWKNQTENGWAAVMADDIKTKELPEAVDTMKKVLAGMLQDTTRIDPDDLFKE